MTSLREQIAQRKSAKKFAKQYAKFHKVKNGTKQKNT